MKKMVTQHKKDVYVHIDMDDIYGSPVRGGKKTLCDAVMHKDFHLCQRLLSEGEEENVLFRDKEDGSTLLHILAKKCSKQETRAQKISVLLLQHGADVNAKDKNGDAPLHIAAREGQRDLCLIFLEHQRDGSPKINIRNKKSMTPLHYAAQQGQLQVVELLLEEGADPSIRDNQKYCPLHHAAENGYHTCCKVLVPFYSDDPEQVPPPVTLAARKGFYLCYREMLGVQMNLNYRDDLGNTALHTVAKLGFEKFVVALLDTDADPNVQNNVGNTPIMEAILRGKKGCVTTLIDKGADLSVRNKFERGVLHAAASKKADECMDSLLKKECVKKRIDERDQDGYTALCIAVKKHNEKCALLLLAAGASPLVGAQQRFSLLHVAAESSRPLLLERLLSFEGLDVNSQNGEKETPLHVAARKGSRESCQMLLRKGARVNVQDENGRTALHLSAYQGHPCMARFLIKNGAYKRAKDDQNCTALHGAAAKGNLECCQVLTDADRALYKEQDKWKRYALDIAFQKGHDKVFQFLLDILPQRDISMMPQDLCEHLHSHVHKALKNRHRTAVEAIVKSRWWEAGFGSSKKHEEVYCTNFRELIKLYPVLAMKVMDKCKTLSTTEANSDLFDFRLFEDNYYIKEDRGCKASFGQSPFDPSTWKVLPSAEELTSDVLIWKQEHPVNIMAVHGCLGLLEHSLTEAWLNHKWKSYSRWIFFGLLFLQIISVFTLIGFMVYVMNWNQICDKYSMSQEEFCDANLKPHKDLFGPEGVNITGNATMSDSVRKTLNAQMWNSAISHSLHLFVLLSVIFQIIVEVNSGMRMKWDYVCSTTFVVKFPSLILSVVLLFPGSYCGFRLGIKTAFIWQCGIVALLIQGFQLIHFISKLPQFSIFVTITKNFLHDFFKGLMFIGMVISLFALTFYLLLRDQPAFQTVPQALVKTVVWLLGDLGYDDTFLSGTLAYPFLVNALFLVFVCNVAVFVVTLVRTPSSNEREILLYRKAGRVQLILNLDVCYPWFRRGHAAGKHRRREKTSWLIATLERFLRPRGVFVVSSLSAQCDKAALMRFHDLRRDHNKHWFVLKVQELLRIFKNDREEERTSEFAHPLQEQLEEQTKKLDQLLDLYSQLNSYYMKQNEQILELRQQVESMKKKSTFNMLITRE